MKLVSFRADGRESYGVVAERGIVDLGARLGGRYPTLDALIAAKAYGEARELAAAHGPDHAADAIEYLPPIADPDKIIALQLNYRAHIEELKDANIDIPIPDKFPSFFMRPKSSHVGHKQEIWKPRESDKLDFEGELAVVIGERCRRVPRERALGVLAGYSCYNEGSVRDWQMRAPQLTGGKIWYRSGAFGPWLVTADEIPDPARLRLTTRINGEIRQDAPVSDLLFDVPYLVSYLSTITELLPGDVIVTGTPGRTGGLMREFLKPGDLVEIELSGIGTLANRVAAE